MSASDSQRPAPIPLARPETRPEAEAAVLAVLRSGHLVRGSYVGALEDAIAQRVGVPHAIMVSSGTAALDLALRAAGVGPGDEVVMPDLTFPALAAVVLHLGAVPVTVDVSLNTFNADAASLLAAVGPRTRAVVPVHQFGLTVDLGPLMAVAAERGFAVVEDAACALGATRNGVPCGRAGDAACFSFHPRKLVTCGEGGCVVTRDAALHERVARLSNHGMDLSAPAEARFAEAGWNLRLSDLHAALATGQMERLDETIARRRAVAAAYGERLDSVSEIIVPAGHRDPEHAFQAFVVLVEEGIDRDRVVRGLGARGIGATLGSYAIHLQPAFRGRVGKHPRPGAQAAFDRSLALPLFAALSAAEVDRVVMCLVEAVEEAK